jgi:hypothetical protein
MSRACHVQVCDAMPSDHSECRSVVANAAPCVAQEANDALLDATGPVVGEHALVIGHDTPAVVSELACHGATEITLLGPNAQPDAATVDVVVVTGVACVGYAQRAVERACRALSHSGRIVLRSTTEADDDLCDGIAHTLRAAGFSGLRLRIAGGRLIASAHRPRLSARRAGRAAASGQGRDCGVD